MAFSMNEQVKVISKAIHRPLSLVTLPEIETRQKLNHNTDKKHIYLFYKPEGQVNGRLSSEKVGDDFICPHTLSQESRSLIGLQETGSKMISLDYSHMEVSMLACVSQDALLTQINNENVDAYEEIYSRIFEAPCDSQDKRNLIKKIFLPIMYGEQAKTLSEGLSVSYQEAFNLIHRIQTVFKTAYDYLSDKQNELSAQVNQQIDSTGRMRIFDNALAARNFNIQSPSALICLEKLIELNEKLPVLISIHDEYVLAYKPREIVDTFQEAKTILTKPSQFYPNVKLHIKAKFGKNLKEMTPIPKKYYCA
jgi:DNA polymerase I-like protein with 3'-5' exonuclease and polymerase domains